MNKILFVHPNASKKIYQELANSHAAREVPIWSLLLANHCRSRGIGVEILDCEAGQLSNAEAVIQINDVIKPDLVVMVVYGQQPSASTQNMEGATSLAELLKYDNKERKILFVGGHVAALPLEVLSEPYVDFVCQNEGVYTISSLAATDMSTDLHKILGLGWKDPDGTPHLNLSSPIVAQADLERDLPGMAWDLIDINKYRTSNWHANFGDTSKFASIYTSLGCIYKCSFCMINIVNRTDPSDGIASHDSAVFRYWSPEFMIEELDKVAKLGVTNLKIADEMYVLKPKHFMRLSELLGERDYGFNIWCYSRIDTIKEKYLETLKKSGVNWVALGIEAANRNIRQEVTKGKFQDVDIAQVVKDIQGADINVIANYIFGLPEETHATMRETLDLSKELLAEFANFYSTMAYPGSPLHVEARQNGWILPQTYDGYSQHSYNCTPLSGTNLSATDTLRFRDNAWNEYFTYEPYLSFIETKFGRQQRINIEELTKIKLKRKLLGD